MCAAQVCACGDAEQRSGITFSVLSDTAVTSQHLDDAPGWRLISAQIKKPSRHHPLSNLYHFLAQIVYKRVAATLRTSDSRPH